jgi:K+-sensing histidine kinase KdpD
MRYKDSAQSSVFTETVRRAGHNAATGYLVAVIGVSAITLILQPFHLQISATTVALSLLLVVLLTASVWGSRPAAVASVLGVLFFNYYFLPPVGAWTIADPENWFALAAFLVTAVIAGQLSAYANRRAEVAETRQIEIERLYEELREAFEKASHAEALRQSEKLKSALLDAVTHDIRTPLTSIKASVTTLLNERRNGAGADDEDFILDNESRREMLDVINEESDRLNRFVEDLVELARIEAGEVKLRRQFTRPKDIISNALTRAKSLVGNHKIEIDLDPQLPQIHVDSRAVSEVVYTLLDNAAKYSPPGTVIRISGKQISDSKVSISVEDEGEGVAPAMRERVFEKFFRAIHDTESGSRRPSGSGMGLAIAKGIIEAHNGSIHVCKRPLAQSGAVFEFILPITNE